MPNVAETDSVGGRGTILVTGGAGFIGSHCAVELLNENYNVVIVDNLRNSYPEAIKRIEHIAERSVDFRKVDVSDPAALEQVFADYATPAGSKINAVIHFAGLKAVGESHDIPLDYYQTNIGASINLFRIMQSHKVTKLVFSSSCTVYGDPPVVPMHEECTTIPFSPYGRSKYYTENIIQDVTHRYGWKSAILRYFNPVGAHPSGDLGEHPQDIPNNLMPYLAQVAIGKLAKLTVFGNDYPTHDGTGVRDYIHVMDLVKGHLRALQAMDGTIGAGKAAVINLGTGTGYSVLDMIKAYSKAAKMDLPFVVGSRRAGDAAAMVADPKKASKLLEWTAEFGLDEMCRDSWQWQEKNPEGTLSRIG